MSDIYKNNQRMPSSNPPPKQRRRASSRRAFDDKGDRQRRSRNTGLRRMLHLIRKGENEKVFWWSMLVAFVVILVAVAVWQFVVLENRAKQKSEESEYVKYQRNIPQQTKSAQE